MARIVVSAKKSSVNDPGITRKIYLQAPEEPTTPIKATLGSDVRLKF